MRCSTIIPIAFGAVVTAQSSSPSRASATIMNPFDDKTITAVSVDDQSVTHYTHHCTPRPATISPIISALFNPETSGETPAPTEDAAPSNVVRAAAITPAPYPRIVKRDAPDNFGNVSGLCFDYQLLQGPSTWAVHLTDSEPGLWTLDAGCTFGDGGIASATVSTCIVTEAGVLATESTAHTTTEIKTRLATDQAMIMQTLVLETASGKLERLLNVH
jgi:hypothetical protein